MVKFAKGACCIVLATAVAALGGCTQPEERVTFGGYYFRAKAKPVNKRKTLKDFTVQVRGVSKSLNGARQAGGYEGTRYCIKKYGTSRIIWQVGPGTEPQYLRIEKDQLVFQGSCDPI